MYINKKKNYPYYKVRTCESIREMIDSSERIYKDKKAFRFTVNGKDASVSYTEFKDTVDALGTAIYSLGFGKAHIAIVAENCYKWVLSYVAALMTEGVVTPVDKELPDGDIANILNHSECDVVIYSSALSKKIVAISDKLETVKLRISLNSVAENDGADTTIDELVAKGTRLLEEGDTDFLDVVPDIHGLKQLIYTSGTTGKSKGVMLSEETLCFNIVKSQELMKITERCLSVLPYNHCYEATCGLLTMLHNGMTICINESLRTIVPNMKKYKPTEMQIVPLFAEKFYSRIWETIEAQGKTKKVKFGIKLSNALLKLGIDRRESMFKQIRDAFGGDLKILICGGAPLKPHLTEFFESIGIVMINGYGITECGPLISINRPEYHNFKSVGLPLKDTELRIFEPNENGEGEIIVKGKNVMLGYYKNDEETAKVIRNGYFHTGDIGKIDKDGFVYITGRMKNVIILKNGKNIYPEELEEQLLDIPLVKEVVVYAASVSGDDDKALGAEIFPDYEMAAQLGVTDVETEIKSFVSALNKKQPSYKTIKQFKFRNEEFDKTTTKKIKRKYNN